MGVSKDRNSIIKSSESVARGTAVCIENEKSVIKDDSLGQGREYVRRSLTSAVKDDLINIYNEGLEKSPSQKSYSIALRKEQQEQSLSSSAARSPERQNIEQHQSTYRRKYLTPEKTGSSQLSGAAAAAAYVFKAEGLIQDPAFSNGREYARNTHLNSVKNDLLISDYASSELSSTKPLRKYKGYSVAARKERRQNPAKSQTNHSQGQNTPSSTKNRIYSTPEPKTGSMSLNGAAAPAAYFSTTEKVIKDDMSGISREYVRKTLESSLKDQLIKLDKSPVKRTETKKTAPKGALSKIKGGQTAGLSKSEARPLKAVSEAQIYAKQKFNKRNKPKGFIGLTTGCAYQSLANTAVQSTKEADLGSQTAGQSIKHLIRVPRYTKNAAGLAVETGRNLRYASKIVRDLKAGDLTGKEAGLVMLTRGKASLKGAGIAAVRTLGQAVEEFHGSDDLGIEAVRKPKDVIIATNRTLKVTSRAAKALNQAPQKLKRTLRDMQKTAQKAQQAAKYMAAGLKASFKSLSNPLVLKSLTITGVLILIIIVLISCVSSVSALFSSFTYQADDATLTDTYAYVTELDADLALKIKNIPSEPQWANVDVFNINAFTPMTDPIPILSYLAVKYQDFKFDDVKGEINTIYAALYQLTYHEWTEQDGTVVLDVNLNYTPFSSYIALHKAEMFPKADDYAQYETYNRVGGTAMRSELGSPFAGQNLYVSNRFGYRLDPVSGQKIFHGGIDIPMAAGTQVDAAMSGTVTTGSNADDGNYVLITSVNRNTLYGHCNTFLVTGGQTVSQGQAIATVGTLGNSTGLHLEFTKDGKKLNPLFYIKSEQFVSGTNGSVAGAPLGTDRYTALITEADKYLGYPYVFGGKTPQTSFDCSGFVCWVLTHSGIMQISASAQGLYDSCTPISEAEAKPGDLIFFQKTYDCPDNVSHVGFYVGNGMMLDCGNPIKYESCETSYWQSHFYAFGRLNN